jgi:hypothetical protein
MENRSWATDWRIYIFSIGFYMFACGSVMTFVPQSNAASHWFLMTALFLVPGLGFKRPISKAFAAILLLWCLLLAYFSFET